MPIYKVGKKRPRPGDIAEIMTPTGMGYFQFCWKDSSLGYFVRVFSETYLTRPTDFALIAAAPERFTVFFPLGAAASRGLVQLVANEVIPERHRGRTPLRRRGAIDREGRVITWIIDDGVEQSVVSTLTPEQAQLSPAAIWNDTLLAERIAAGWKPEDDV